MNLTNKVKIMKNKFMNHKTKIKCIFIQNNNKNQII